MFKALMVPVLATGLAFGGSAQKAEALTAEEVAALAAGLIIIGAISSNNSNNNQATTVTRSAPITTSSNTVRNLERRKVLPANCVRRFNTDRGTRNLAIQRCLTRAGFNANRLPDRCEVRVRTDNGARNAFRQRCLENAGYRFRNISRTNDGRVILDARTNR
ncbi:MAG: hypothetical protein AAGM21_07850 [Pseudomonadota bacterium]